MLTRWALGLQEFMHADSNIFHTSVHVKRFYVFFILVTFYVFNVFFVFQTFFIFLKNVGKVQSGKQINKKHFQNNSNETDR